MATNPTTTLPPIDKKTIAKKLAAEKIAQSGYYESDSMGEILSNLFAGFGFLGAFFTLFSFVVLMDPHGSNAFGNQCGTFFILTLLSAAMWAKGLPFLYEKYLVSYYKRRLDSDQIFYMKEFKRQVEENTEQEFTADVSSINMKLAELASRKSSLERQQKKNEDGRRNKKVLPEDFEAEQKDVDSHLKNVANTEATLRERLARVTENHTKKLSTLHRVESQIDVMEAVGIENINKQEWSSSSTELIGDESTASGQIERLLAEIGSVAGKDGEEIAMEMVANRESVPADIATPEGSSTPTRGKKVR